MTTIGFIHTVLGLPPTFAALADELVPDAEYFHIVDETLLGNTRKEGRLTPATRRRVLGYIESAAEAGADLVVVTCSSIGPAVDASVGFVDVPVLRIDEAMADEAVRRGPRIGVLATLATTLRPTAELIRRRAEAAARDVEVESDFDLDPGEGASFDRVRETSLIVRGALETLVERVDVVVLAQASMARVAATLPAEITERTPILSSPRLAAERAARVLAEAPSAGAPRSKG